MEGDHLDNKRIRTFVNGFDDILGGGIPEKKVVLIKGSTGTMKSSLAYYILSRNAGAGIGSLYITFEQDRMSLGQQISSLGLNAEKECGPVHIFDLSKGRERIEELSARIKKLEGGKESRTKPGRKDIVTSLLIKKIEKMKEKMGFKLLAMDSLDGLNILLNAENARVSIFELFEWMRKSGLTAFVICERFLGSSVPGKEETHCEDFLADGIIELKMEPINNVDMQRRIRCVKMRGTKHSSDYFSLFYEYGEFAIAKAMTS